MGLAAFNRMRREQAELEAKVLEGVKPLEEEKKSENKEELSLDEVKNKLDELGVKYSHNTSEKKLRGKLKEAIG